MKPEAAPRDCERPGDKLGKNNGDPRAITVEAIANRWEAHEILRSLRSPMLSPLLGRDKNVDR